MFQFLLLLLRHDKVDRELYANGWIRSYVFLVYILWAIWCCAAYYVHVCTLEENSPGMRLGEEGRVPGLLIVALSWEQVRNKCRTGS